MWRVLPSLFLLFHTSFLASQLDTSGVSWVETESFTETPIRVLFSHGENLFAGTGGDGLFVSNDNGANWRSLLASLEAYEITGMAAQGARIYVTTAKHGVFYSDDEGENWTDDNTGLQYVGTTCIAAARDSVYLGTIAGIYAKAASDTSWTRFILPLHETSRGDFIESIVVTNKGIVAGGTAAVYVKDRDKPWRVLEHPDLVTDVTVVSQHGSQITIGTAGNGFFTLDNMWENLRFDNERVTDYRGSIVTYIYAGEASAMTLATNSGVSLDENGARYNEGLRAAVATCMVKHRGKYYVGTADQGVFIWDRERSKAKTLDSLAKDFFTDGIRPGMVPIDLLVFPNPALAGDEISLVLEFPEGDEGELFVRSADGRTTRQLLSRQAFEPGPYQRSFILEDLPPGSYLITYVGHKYRHATKLTIIRS